ncbi:MAG: WbqC family protein [Bacteroidales bacterium]|nr:WbqC family protein [Bacteroidales bacterium]
MILSTAYLPPIQYVALLCKNGATKMEQWEHYVKQSYRNRSRILSSNGPLDLIVPVEKSQGCKTLLKDVRLAYHDRWNAEHWNAIRSAYNSSPYFEYYVDDIERFFTQQFDFLIDYNTELLDCILNLLKIPHTITYSENFVPLHTENQDFRYTISPKVTTPDVHFPEYPQVFDYKFGFIPNLSILDLLCNLGPESKQYLESIDFGTISPR